MSSAAAGGANKTTKMDNEANIDAGMLDGGAQGEFAATSAVSAEAQQGDGPAAASASGSGSTGVTVETVAVAVSCGKDYAVAACPVAVVAVGVNSASAGSENGVVAVGLEGAAASSNSANSSETAMRDHQGFSFGDDPAVVRLLGAIRGELNRLSADNEAIKAELGWVDPEVDDDAPIAKAEAATSDKHAAADSTAKSDSAGKRDGDKKPGGSKA
ncbi:hypothetical protein CKO28_06845 [Rhodovibrio sodomensis]|uniref:Uncharacterized protein n=1 Tax=Rhodovibrio sodomensis TaxID=1088 RepID=A0ABS1DBC8_9PROT|nr:hypothetical protein [Rhodovibrio sodomensis]MBK1667749.1 hypothetical protein [Rhodovibrio sodomensis]